MMNHDELTALLSGANALDPRVQVNPVTFQLWERVLGRKSYAEAWAAMMVYYERPALDGGRAPVDAPMIRKIIRDETDRAVAKRAALEPARKDVTHDFYERRVQSPEFRALFEQGVAEGNAERDRASRRREAV